MSDERKELAWLEVMINSMERVKGNYYAFYMREGDIDRLKQHYQRLIQKPSLEDEIWRTESYYLEAIKVLEEELEKAKNDR